jgi:hypothetical protein
MAKIKTKINPNLLGIATTHDDTFSKETRAELQTRLAHKRLDKERLQLEIEEIETDIEMLDT